MRCNAAGLNIIKSFEGCRLTPYKDGNGVWTVGYGCTMGVIPGQDITQDQADAMLVTAINQVEASIGKLIKRPLGDNRWSSQVAFVYNIGAGHYKASSALALINQGQFGLVPQAIAKWNVVAGSVSAGLVRRRAAECALWLKPDVQLVPDVLPE